MPIGSGQDGRSAVGSGDPRHVKPGDTIHIVAKAVMAVGDDGAMRAALRVSFPIVWRHHGYDEIEIHQDVPLHAIAVKI